MAENPPSKVNLIYKMKITKRTLQRLIKEELKKALLRENEDLQDYERPGPFTGQRVFRSSEPFTGFRDLKRNLMNNFEPGLKPEGLWYSCGSGWDDFCQMAMPEMVDNAPYVYELQIDLSGMSWIGPKMLVINTGEELERFHENYSRELRPGLNLIDWGYVASVYDGIEICPYQWEYRTKYLWYSGWDVASGCVWGEDAFVSAEQIEDPCRSA